MVFPETERFAGRGGDDGGGAGRDYLGGGRSIRKGVIYDWVRVG